MVAHSACGLLLHNAEQVKLSKVEVTLGAGVVDAGRKALMVENVPGLVTTDFSHREL